MAYWLLSALGYVLVIRGERRHLPWLIAAGAIALVVYAPNLWWNWSHSFVSYLHVRDNADLVGELFHPRALAEFFVSQFGVFGPIFFAALIALAARPRLLAGSNERLLAAFALPTLAMMLSVSLMSRAQPNWAAPTYIAAVILVTAWLLREGRRALVVASIALNTAGAILLFGGRDAVEAAGVSVPAKYDPMHRLRGWRELGNEVGGVLAQHPGIGLLADDRELVSALIYYARPHPFGAAKWNPMRRVKDQWDLTNDLTRHPGEDFLVVSEHNYLVDMSRSFRSIEALGKLTIPLGPGRTRDYDLAIARDFTGYPQDRR
jgi:hypothetical protein